MADIKAGDTVTFLIKEKTLAVEPMPFGKLKKLIKVVAHVANRFDPKTIKDDMLTVVPALVEEYMDECIPLLFDAKTHDFLTKEWIDENLTVPKLKEIIVAAVAVNGLGDFFLKTVRTPAPAAVENLSGTSATLSANTGSITSSVSPTDGGPKTLTN